jgi:hypothetical protein
VKQTLLGMVQDILSNMNSDTVNSISDSPESMQVATIIKQKYFDIVTRVPLPEHEMLLQLDPSLDNTSPVLMYVPDGVASIKWLKYFNSNNTDGTGVNSNFQHDLNTDITSTSGSSNTAPPGYQEVVILPNRDFINMVNQFNPNETAVASFTFEDQTATKHFTFYYRNDRQPQYCTIIKNLYVVFDSFDSTQDSTLQAEKTMFFGQMNPTWQMIDSFIPDLADEQFPLLLNEAKALAFFELKQMPHQLALEETKRGWSTIQKNKAVTNRPTYFNEIPNYGRYGRGGYGVPSYFKLRGLDKS